ncbi:MAG TPA: hypothetical protein VFT64_03620 [Rickettsiales bacterium]|nr:hypothetical protein [Rickettsiales bacterium]
MHTVTVLATNGYGVTRSLIVLDAKPGAHYIVKGSMTAYWTINLTERPYSISWIEDTADNSVVTEKEKATLTPLPPPVVIVR